MKRTVCAIFFLALVSLLDCRAASPDFSFGVEWGYSISLLKAHHINYLDADGSRVSEQDVTTRSYSNANVLASVGLNLGDKTNISICSGYMGVEDNVRVIPALLRVSFAPRGLKSSGFVASIEGGAGMNVLYNDQILGLGGIGAGYRIGLSGKFSIDLKMYLRASYDHPNIYDPTYYGFVPKDRITINQAGYGSAGITVMVNF